MRVYRRGWPDRNTSTSKRIRGDRTGFTRFTHRFQTVEGDCAIMTNKEIILGASDFRDFYISTFIKDRLSKNISTVTEKLCVIGNHKRTLQFVKDTFSNALMFSAGYERLLINIGDAIVEFEPNSNNIEVRFHSTMQRNQELKDLVLTKFDEISIYISWIYDGNMNRATVPIDLDLLPCDEMYPFLTGESLDSYYQRFVESSAGILILIGPPGTGKTSFIRGFLAATESSAIVTYDQKILANDSLFADFIENSSNTLVIEDADLFLSSRKEGNEMMHKFLNVGDGLVTIKGKKMIFSTNLPSINDIDEALLRPGRCFDIVHFGELTKDEAVKMAAKLKIDFSPMEGKDNYTIAEVFTGTRNTKKKNIFSTFGFMPNK